MHEKMKSTGTCIYCSKSFAKAGINRHLKKHLDDKTQEQKPGQSFLVKVEPNPKWGTSPYFLSLWIDGKTTMDEIDGFLRAIWLECCGHMSAFRIPQPRRMFGGGMFDYFDAMELLEQGKTKQYEKMMEEIRGEVPMSRKAEKALYEGLKVEYEYDFGSTTALLMTIVAEYPVKADDKITLLSRNEPLELFCQVCRKEPATVMCIVHDWGEDDMFCDNCAKKHAKTCGDFEDYAAMPVVNSPRMGVCAYDGGVIDQERDGVFKKIE